MRHSATNVSDATVQLGPAETLVLYTDGVSEARRGDEFFDDERVEAAITDLAGRGTAAEVASGLADAAVSFQGGDPRDDIAVVALKVKR